MIRNGILTVATFLSALLFPWPLTAALAIVTSFFEPLVPLAVGIFADALYYSPASGGLPMSTIYGLSMSLLAILVRRWLSASIIS